MAAGGAVDALVEMKRQGLVDHNGISGGPIPMLIRLLDPGVLALRRLSAAAPAEAKCRDDQRREHHQDDVGLRTVNADAHHVDGIVAVMNEKPDLGASSNFDPASFTRERCADAVRAGVAFVLLGQTGVVLWID